MFALTLVRIYDCAGALVCVCVSSLACLFVCLFLCSCLLAGVVFVGGGGGGGSCCSCCL